MTVEVVSPVEFAATASELLLAAWKRPVLNYSPAYLRWQFAFPGTPGGRAVAAFDGSEAIGFAGATSRRFTVGQHSVEALVLSFVAVRPSARGAGVAGRLYAALLESFPATVPVVVFTEPGSAGERVMLRAFRDAHYQHYALDVCQGFGFAARSGRSPRPLSAAQTAGCFDRRVIDVSATPRVLWNDPSAAQCEHYLADPRGRRRLITEDAEGQVRGDAMVVNGEILTADGVQIVPMFESAYVAPGDADALRDLFQSALIDAPAGMVIASNLSHLDQATVRAAGARAMPSAFNAHLFASPSDSRFAAVTCCNLEVI